MKPTLVELVTAAAALFFLIFAFSAVNQLDAQLEAERIDRCEAMVGAGIPTTCLGPQ